MIPSPKKDLRTVRFWTSGHVGRRNSIGFDKLNQTVRARLVERLVGIVGEEMGS